MLAGNALVAAAGMPVVAADGGESLPIIPHFAEVIVGFIAFVVLYFVGQKFAVPAFEKMYAERSAAIEGGMREAEEAQAQADAALAQYKAQLATAREEANQIREEARADAAQIAAQVREQANSDADRILSTAHKQIDAERSQAANQLQGDLGRLATDLASRIVGESLTDTALQQRVIDRFLADLETAAPQNAQGLKGQGV